MKKNDAAKQNSGRKKPGRGAFMLIAATVGGFLALLFALDELLDLPERIFGGPLTPINYYEMAMECSVVLIVCLFMGALAGRILGHEMEPHTMISTMNNDDNSLLTENNPSDRKDASKAAGGNSARMSETQYLKGWNSLWVITLLMFCAVFILNQLDEILDLPHVIFGAPATPINWTEMLIEGVSIVVIGLICVVGVKILSSRHMQTQLKIAHLNVLMAAVSRVSRLISREKDQDKLITGICRALVGEGSYCMAWIALLDENRRVTAMAQAGMGDQEELSRRVSDDLMPACRKHIIDTEFVHVINREVAECLECGLHKYNPGHSALLVALRYRNKTYGILGVSGMSGMALGSEEQELLKELAQDITLALWGMDAGNKKDAAELALQESEDRYRVVFDSSPHGIVIAQAEDMRIRYANPAMCRMLEYTPSEMLNLRLTEIHPTEQLENTIKEYESQLRGEKTHSSEILCHGKNGKNSHVIMNCEEVIFDGRKHIACFFNDVSGRRMLEDQLRQSQKLEAIGRLAGGVAHDFNNLLSVIITFSGFALESLSEDDPLFGDILEIRKAGERAAVLTRQLLAFSRKQVLQPQVLDLSRVIEGMEGMLRRMIGEDIELYTNIDPRHGMVKADPGQIEQIIMNLAVNSRDAMPNGGKLTIEIGNADLDESYAGQHVAVSPGQYVMLSVSDNGCGMDEVTRERIFEPFFTTKEAGKGTGLGMSTVYGFVKQSGGNIWVYSEPGHGTSIKIYLPRVEQVSEEQVILKPQQPVRASGERTILVVEDDVAVRSLVKRILENSGYRVITAASGDEAIKACEQSGHKVDLLLTDVIMPQMNGRQLNECIQKKNPGMRVLFMSGYTDNAIANHGVLEPGVNFIGKPFSVNDLTEKVQQILGVPPEKTETGDLILPPPSPETGKNFAQG